MEENHNIPSDTQKEQLSALESINASFAALKEEASRDGKKLVSHDMETKSSGTIDKINASFAAARRAAAPAEKEEEDSQHGGVWNVITGILVVVLIAAAVLFLVVIHRGIRQGEGDAAHTPAVQETDTEGQSENGRQEDWADTGTEKDGTPETQVKADGEQADAQTETEQTDGQPGTQAEAGQTEAAGAGRAIPEEYETILNEEEKEEWKNRETDSSRLFVQLNQKLNVDKNRNAYLRLINPPYSAFYIQIKIYEQDNPETVLYQSDSLKPGTILEYAEFDSVPEPGQYGAEVEYTVYDKDGNKVGTHEVAVDMTVQEQQEAAGQ